MTAPAPSKEGQAVGAAVTDAYGRAWSAEAEAMARAIYRIPPDEAVPYPAIQAGERALAFAARQPQAEGAAAAEVKRLRAERDDWQAGRLVSSLTAKRLDYLNGLLAAEIDARVAAERRAEAAGAENDRLCAMLRQVEWAATSRHAGFAPAPACPCCGGIVGPQGTFPGVVGHAPDCALAAQIAPRDAPVSRPGRLASEDARAEATRLPEQPSQGFAHQSRGDGEPIAHPVQSKTDADRTDAECASIAPPTGLGTTGPTCKPSLQVADHTHPLTGDTWRQDPETGLIVETVRADPVPSKSSVQAYEPVEKIDMPTAREIRAAVLEEAACPKCGRFEAEAYKHGCGNVQVDAGYMPVPNACPLMRVCADGKRARLLKNEDDWIRPCIVCATPDNCRTHSRCRAIKQEADHGRG